jgi:hypothetical protein
MSVEELRTLLDAVPDTREIVLRRGAGPSAERDAWREAHDEAVDAYRRWHTSRKRAEYARYRAAQDRADAAQDALAGPGVSRERAARDRAPARAA